MNISGALVWRVIKLFTLVLAISALSGCRFIDLKQMVQPSKFANDLLIDGYYVYKNEPYLRPIVFYRDGSCYLGSVFLSEENIDRMVSKTGSNNALFNDYGWGFFHVTNGLIRIQVAETLHNGLLASRVGVLEYTGRIISDTSFVIQTIKIPRENKVEHLDEEQTYYFRPQTLKPDSSNWVKAALKK